MNKPKVERDLIVGLDIGTSKIVAIVAEIRPEGGFEIVGLGSYPSRGLRRVSWSILKRRSVRYSVRLKKWNSWQIVR